MKVKVTWTIPNILTTVRLLAIPVMAFLIYMSGRSPEHWHRYSIPAFCFFVGIWLTDALDGFIARHYGQVSDFGKIYDPFVDKLFQFATAFMLFVIGHIHLWVVVFMLVKDALYLLGGAYLLQVRHKVVHARWYGKVSTILFVAAFGVVFFVPPHLRQITSYIFIPPVLMVTYATVRYGMLLFGESGKQSGETGSDKPK